MYNTRCGTPNGHAGQEKKSRMTSTSARLVTIDVQETLRFFDEKPEWSMSGANGKSHATAMVAVFGEDLNAACFQRYIECTHKGARAVVRPESVTQGNRGGRQLDRWITVDWSDGSKTVFQTEIKNWSAHAFGGKTLPIRANAKDLEDYKQKRWELKWDSARRTPKSKVAEQGSIEKVLLPMKLPSGLKDYAKDIRPLLNFWEPIAPRDKADEHLFRMDTSNDDFPILWVFSVSSYLRSIREASIELEMPDAADRLRILGRLLK